MKQTQLQEAIEKLNLPADRKQHALRLAAAVDAKDHENFLAQLTEFSDRFSKADKADADYAASLEKLATKYEAKIRRTDRSTAEKQEKADESREAEQLLDSSPENV